MNELRDDSDLPPDNAESAFEALDAAIHNLRELKGTLDMANTASRTVIAGYQALRDLSNFIDTGEISIDEIEEAAATAGMGKVIRLPSNPG